MTISIIPKLGSGIFLHTNKKLSEALQLFATTPSGKQWQNILHQPAADICKQFDLVVTPSAFLNSKFSVTSNMSVAIWCSNYNELSELCSSEVDTTIIFSPSAFSILEAQRCNRKIIILAKGLKRDDKITASHLMESSMGNTNMNGISILKIDLFIGLYAAYDLDAGQAIDFGYVK